jgi:hypothetical protein
MQPVRKNDTVILSDSVSGKVLDIITTSTGEVFKIQKFPGDQIMYVEAHMVRLGKQCRRNYMLTISHEVVGFLPYILNRLIRD